MAAESDRIEPMDSEQDEEDVYEVERIIDMRVEEVPLKLALRLRSNTASLTNMASSDFSPLSRRLTHLQRYLNIFCWLNSLISHLLSASLYFALWGFFYYCCGTLSI